jgi:hypothetical protein
MTARVTRRLFGRYGANTRLRRSLIGRGLA